MQHHVLLYCRHYRKKRRMIFKTAASFPFPFPKRGDKQNVHNCSHKKTRQNIAGDEIWQQTFSFMVLQFLHWGTSVSLTCSGNKSKKIAPIAMRKAQEPQFINENCCNILETKIIPARGPKQCVLRIL